MKLCKKLRLLPSFEQINRLLDYCSETGNLRWKLTVGRAKEGDIAGGFVAKGYKAVRINQRRMYSHRLAWLLHYGGEPAGFIDHIDGCRSNNKITNLRLANRFENQWNRKLNKQSSSGIKGLHWAKRDSLWQASLNNKTLGHFKNKEDAIACVRSAREKAHGAFTNHG